MYSIDDYLAELIVNRPADKVRCLTEPCGPSRRMGRGQQGWLSLQGRRLAGQLGRQLVELGERLQGYGLPQPSC